VILYEMLTGTLPTGAGDQPDKPSVVTHGSSLSKAAWSDLDVLCLKAISGEPHERYQSVEALIRDLDHYLKGEPLEARPDSLPYRFRKFVVRNRSAVLAASLTTTAVLGLVIFFTLRLAAARNSALAEATRTQRVERFLESLFEGGDKDAGPADNLRVTTLLDRGVQEARGLNSDPAVQSELYETLGTVYRQLGRLDRADSLLHFALERRKLANHQDESLMADNLLELGLLRVDQAQLSEAERLIRKALAIDQRHFPSGHPKIVKATAALGRVLEEQGHYDQAIELLNGSLRFQPTQSATIDLANSLVLLADAHFYLGHYAASDSLNWQALRMRQQLYGSQHPRVAENFINLGNAQIQLGHYPEAEQHFRQALAINQSWYGETHPDTARAESYLAQALNWEGRYDESRILTQKALTTTEQTYGKEHPRVALMLSNLGSIDLQLRKLDAAEADFNRMTAIYRSAYGEQHQFTALALANLATVYLKEEQYDRAEQVFRDVLQIYNRVLPAGHVNTAIAQIKLGRVLVRQNRYREAEEHTLAGYEILAKQASPSLDYLQGARSDLVKIYEALQQPDKATKFRAELAANQPKSIPVLGRH
jgi:serine/threonine-protein kinase